MEPLIKVNKLTKQYIMGDEIIHALNDVSFTINKGDFVCLLGTSGSGKSTLLNMMAGLEKPTQGLIQIGKIRISELNEKDITIFRKLNIGFVFQSYNLISSMTALENVAFALMFKGVKKDERLRRAKKILQDVGLLNRMDHKPNEMSGGQQQRVSIARAFVDQPKIVFADEPTGNLDTKTSEEIMNLMTGIAKKYHQTLVIVSHDPETAQYCNKIIEIKDGKIFDIISKK